MDYGFSFSPTAPSYMWPITRQVVNQQDQRPSQLTVSVMQDEPQTSGTAHVSEHGDMRIATTDEQIPTPSCQPMPESHHINTLTHSYPRGSQQNPPINFFRITFSP